MIKRKRSNVVTFKPKPVARAVISEINQIGSSAMSIGLEVPEQTWEELEDLYQQIAISLVTTANGINEMIKIQDAIHYVNDLNELKTIIEGVKSDIEIFTDQLTAIHSKHNSRTGKITDADDLVLSLSIFEEYVNFNTRFTSILIPNAATVTDMMTEAYTHYKETVEHGQ